jgi:hypothetical protein
VPPCEYINKKLSSSPSKPGAPEENAAYLKVEKPRFLFLEGSAEAVVAPVVTTSAPPDAPAALAGASAVRTASSTDRPAVGASAPAVGACSSAASAALGDGSGGSHLSGWGLSPIAPLFPLLRRRILRSRRGERVHTARATGTPHPAVPGAPVAGPSSPCRPLLQPSLRRAHGRSGSGRGRGGPRGIYIHPLLKTTVKTTLVRCEETRGETYSPPGRREA